MNYTVEFNQKHYPHLMVTARKKSLKHRLLTIESGLALIKLGKQEYAVEANMYFWLPFNSLNSITYLPNSVARHIDFSVRCSEPFVKQAGFIEPSLLLRAITERLPETKAQSPEQKELLSVVRREMAALNPQLLQSPLTKSVNHSANSEKLSKDIQLCLIIREARKRLLSGTSETQIVTDLFAGNYQEYQQLCLLVLGKPLTEN